MGTVNHTPIYPLKWCLVAVLQRSESKHARKESQLKGLTIPAALRRVTCNSQVQALLIEYENTSVWKRSCQGTFPPPNFKSFERTILFIMFKRGNFVAFLHRICLLSRLGLVVMSKVKTQLILCVVLLKFRLAKQTNKKKSRVFSYICLRPNKMHLDGNKRSEKV